MSLAVFGANARQEAQPSLAVLVADYSALLFRVAHSILRNRAEAEDAVQDTFLRVIQNQHKLPAVRDLRPWLIRITWNLALDRRRRAPTDQLDELFAATLVAQSTPADIALHDARQMAAVLKAIDALPRLERQVLLLTALEELDAAEVAAVLGKSNSAVRSLLFRARTHLKERLSKGAVA